MKKKRNLFIPLIVIIVAIILFVIAFLWVKNLKEDSKQSTLIMENIKAKYDILENNIKEYNNIRTQLVNQLENSYMENLNQDYEAITQSLEKIENNIKEDQKLVENIDQNCQDQVFSEAKVNTICSTYQEIYEKLVNIYLNDIKELNKRVKTYNETTEEPLEEYSLELVKDYIDYNKDGKYSEREEQ